MKNYYQFVKELALKNNTDFRTQLLNPQTKKLWAEVRPKKVRTSKVVTEQKVKKTPGVKVDLSRATIVPAEAKQEPDRLLDYYNQRWSNFVNTIPVEMFRDRYTLEKRPKELKPYNLTSLNYLLNDKRAVYEDSPFSYELSSYIMNPRTFFLGKRSIKIIRNDPLRISNNFKDIVMYGSTLNIPYDFEYDEFNRKRNITLYQQVGELEKKLARVNNDLINLIYLNDMMYDKRALYSLIFLYGAYLSKKATRDKNLIVVSSNNIGNGVSGFYSNLDAGYFNSLDFPIELPSVTDSFNFSNIILYLSGKSNEVLTKAPSPFKLSYMKEKPKEKPGESSSVVASVVEAAPSGVPPHLYAPFPHDNDEIFPKLDKEFSQRIYFKLGPAVSFKNDTKANDKLKVGDFVYYEKGYLSQVIDLLGNQAAIISVFIKENTTGEKLAYGRRRLQARSNHYVRPVEFVKKELKNSPGIHYTSLKNLALGEDKTYEEVYLKYKDLWSDEVDSSNVRGEVTGKLQMKKGPNDFLSSFIEAQPVEEQPVEVQPVEAQEQASKPVNLLDSSDEEEVSGGAVNELDLSLWLSFFKLKGCDVISDVGNGQKAYLLSF